MKSLRVSLFSSWNNLRKVSKLPLMYVSTIYTKMLSLIHISDGYNTEMPDADKANRQIIGDKLKAYEHGEMEERQESRNRAIGQLCSLSSVHSLSVPYK